MTSALFMILQAAQTAPGRRSSMLPFIIQLVAIIFIFYFLLIRPQRKMQQQHRELISSLKKGDDVMTEGGILGQVVHLAEDRVTIKTAENTRIVVARPKIARVITPDASATETKA